MPEQDDPAWRHLLGHRVKVVDVKERNFMGSIGRTGLVMLDADFGHIYLSFDDGGSANAAEVIVEKI